MSHTPSARPVLLLSVAFLFYGIAFPHISAAQDDPDVSPVLEDTLAEISIEAVRIPSITNQDAPLSVSVLVRSTERRNFEPALSLDEVLAEMPGLQVNDRGNAAIGERISIRGMGWRAAFGVRGVQVILDGIPLTMPDGQSFADIVSPSMVQRAEVIRGPASLFWGNGSGGVLFLSTRSSETEPGTRIRLLAGGESLDDPRGALHQLSLENRSNLGDGRLRFFVSNDQRVGSREYSSSRFTRAALYATLPLRSTSVLQISSAIADQDAENPGQLTLEQFREDPDLANARNVDTRAGKESLQAQLGAKLLHQTTIGEFSATLYGIVRDLDNPLSFTYIDLNRLAGGVRLVLQDQSDLIEWGLGIDIGVQDDDRRNINNIDGNPGEQVSLAQDETVRNLSPFAFVRKPLIGSLSATVGLRADYIRFSMKDRFLDNGDQSGDRTFSSFSPAIGLSYSRGSYTLYTNFRNAFETPTTTELVNRPDLDGGFNPNVDPQRVIGFEVGARGTLPFWNSTFDLAVYTMDIQDRLVPFQTEAGGDRTFYRNAGENLHQGVELSFSTNPLAWMQWQITHSSNRFEYRADELRGNRLPGIPDHRTDVFLRLRSAQLWFQGSFRHITSYYVDDANTQKNDAYSVVDATIGLKPRGNARMTINPFLKLSNVFDETYSGSVVINAFGGRYYEPSPGRSLQLGLTLDF